MTYDMTYDKFDDEKRHDRLILAAKSSGSDAAPRITTEQKTDGVSRIDAADTAAVRPENPDKQH
ncbi:hypothetical protein GCM10007382_05350 [Salinibacterium xinjiangense]|uniref:Uncharacterized protein n=1 Tax=Salinibacterium xinjiangense TaxID=386302 RepID=A0A2C8ZJS1_9MICO|nr:hypothetical protein [Salinibacterium xinjiangense]GGK88431.1 hypothetical protein GCM10007382_05350 [Salinibacterium xinjiangense]SOE65131.1 hypothetical protein SAMN06296378_1506 [Salinibacterium xinjiangense]